MFLPSLPSPWAGPYQVARAGDQSEYKVYEANEMFLGLKEEEGRTWSVESEATMVKKWENVRTSVRAILSQSVANSCLYGVRNMAWMMQYIYRGKERECA